LISPSIQIRSLCNVDGEPFHKLRLTVPSPNVTLDLDDFPTTQRSTNMSNRQYKSQASSSRAAAGGGGFGGFGSASSSGSVLSYLTPPPDLKYISDPNVVVAFKGLSKKDATTKTKALEDLRAFVESPPEFQAAIESAILEAWVSQCILYLSTIPPNTPIGAFLSKIGHRQFTTGPRTGPSSST
jgi:hypothetical protein